MAKRRGEDGMVRVKVRVQAKDGREWTETASGDSARQAVWKARERYRDQARVDPAEPDVQM